MYLIAPLSPAHSKGLIIIATIPRAIKFKQRRKSAWDKRVIIKMANRTKEANRHIVPYSDQNCPEFHKFSTMDLQETAYHEISSEINQFKSRKWAK